MIDRDSHIRALRRLFSSHPVIVLAGPRGVGKSTLAQDFAQRSRAHSHFFDLRSAADRARLDDAALALSDLEGLIVLDEIHRALHVLPAISRLLRRPWSQARILLISSIATQSLHGELEQLSAFSAWYELPGLRSPEIPVPRANRLWLRGGLPASYGADSDSGSYEWRDEYFRDFLERDIHGLSSKAPVNRIERFLTMLAHSHGQVWNGSDLARSLGVSHHTARRYLNLLESAFLVRTLKPWRAELPKRQVKSPRVYFRDSGLLHYCLGISTQRELERHPKSGASWEGFMLENLIGALRKEDTQFYFWAAHTGARVDLIVQGGGLLRGFRIRRTSTPRMTRSIETALEDLSLTRMDIIHAGPRSRPLGSRVRAISAERLHEDL